jgi:membrane protease YdiL (CAAX protease family)
MRSFAWFLGAVLAAGLIGAAVAYPGYELALHLAPWAFHRVASRIAMLLLALELVWLCRHLGIRSKPDFGFALPWRRYLRVALLFGLIGVATAAAGAAFLLGTGLRVLTDPALLSPLWLLHLALIGLGSGISVALLEETVFRGAMHTAIARESGTLAAVLLTAPLFAILHFFAKASIPADQVTWSSGFDLLHRSFAPLSQPAAVFDSFCAWLAVGLLLSLTRALTGNIAAAVGLHAGWVLVLRMLQEGTVRGSGGTAYAGWVGRFDGLLGYWLLPWAALIGLALWHWRGRWAPYASGASSSRR